MAFQVKQCWQCWHSIGQRFGVCLGCVWVAKDSKRLRSSLNLSHSITCNELTFISVSAAFSFCSWFQHTFVHIQWTIPTGCIVTVDCLPTLLVELLRRFARPSDFRNQIPSICHNCIIVLLNACKPSLLVVVLSVCWHPHLDLGAAKTPCYVGMDRWGEIWDW